MLKKEIEIIQQSMRLFMASGVKSLTMDDVARGLGISKKTLYNFVSDKNDLVEKTLMYSCEGETNAIESICDKGMNAIEESYEISNYIFNHIDKMHPSIIFDLQKYHILAWEKFTNRKREHIRECYTKNIERGIEEGYYRNDINVPIIVQLYTSRFDAIFNPDLFPVDRFNPADSYREMFRYHIRGIASDKGIKYFNKKINKEKNSLS